jgi:hypothetical protein
MKRFRPVSLIVVLFLGACASQNPTGDPAMENVSNERILHARESLERETTFYSFTRGTVVFEVSALDLARFLEKGPRTFDAQLAARLRAAIAASVSVIREEELLSVLARRALFALDEVFTAGGFRIRQGAETGSSLVVGKYNTVSSAGVVFFWSKSRTVVFSVTYLFVD